MANSHRLIGSNNSHVYAMSLRGDVYKKCRFPSTSTTYSAFAAMSDNRQRSTPLRLPSPIKHTEPFSILMILCTTKWVEFTQASTISPLFRFLALTSSTLSMPPIIKGNILRPLTGRVTRLPNSISLIASQITKSRCSII